MDFKAALQTQPPRSPATPFFFVIPFVTHVFDHTHICERALLHTEFAMASVRDFAHRIPVRCGKKSYQHGCRTAQLLSGYHGLKSQGFRRCCGVRNFYRGGVIKLNPGSCSHDHVRSVTEARRLCHHPLVARSLLRQRMTLGAWQTHPFNSGTKQPSLALSVPSTAPAPSVGDGFGIP